MSALECLTYQAVASASTSDALPMSDGVRAGVPPCDGDPTTLAGYAFRVRLLEARFSKMDETEKKKQGPLGLAEAVRRIERRCPASCPCVYLVGSAAYGTKDAPR